MTERVAVVGDALVDVIDGAAIPGGAALNVAVGLQRLGVPTSLVAMVGDDEPGSLVRAHCAEHGVHLVATPAPLGTAVATAEHDGDSMRYAFNAAGLGRFVDLDAASELLDRAPLVVVSCLALEHEAQLAPLLDLDGAAERLLVDPNARAAYLAEAGARERFAAGLDALAARAMLVKVSDEDTALVYGEDADATVARWIEAGTVVAITRGPAGARIVTGSGWVDALPSVAEPVVDTVGAGDSVLASLTASVLRGEHRAGWAAPLERAMAVAAATIRSPGGLLQLPSTG